MNDFDFAIKNFTTASGLKIKYYSLNALENNGFGDFSKMPKSVKILLESLIRMQSHPAYTSQHVELLSKWTPNVKKDEIPYMPARVLLQDFTGVPCVVDLAALRSQWKKLISLLLESNH